MQRKATKQSRTANKAEKAFISWTKGCTCICCNLGPVEVHHIYGSSAKRRHGLERVMVGHWAVIPLCEDCHRMVGESKRKFIVMYGEQEYLWLCHRDNYPETIPENVIGAIVSECA